MGREDHLRNLRKGVLTFLVGGDCLDEGIAVDAPVLIEEGTPLPHQVRVSKIERAVEVTQIHLAQIVEEGSRVSHDHCLRMAAVVRATSLVMFW